MATSTSASTPATATHARLGRITPCLWFDSQAEEAARYYCGIFPNSHIGLITHYGEVGQEIHGRPPGSVLTVAFKLDGQSLTALNGGRSSHSPKRCRSKSTAKPNPRWTTTGIG